MHAKFYNLKGQIQAKLDLQKGQIQAKQYN